MFGSDQNSTLMRGRRIVWRQSADGVPLSRLVAETLDFILTYKGDRSQLLFGYWDYGSELVITEPDEEAPTLNPKIKRWE
jgi:hypothetical protein